MTLQTRKFDIAELLDTDDDIRAFLVDVAEDATPKEFVRALNVAARAKGLTDIGEVVEALGLRLSLQKAA